jgi:hypothetical protein
MGSQRPRGRVDDGLDPEAAKAGRRPGQVIGVVHADPQLDQAPGGGGDEHQLAAAVTSGEPAVALVGQPELLVVGRGLRHVGHPEGERRQLVQGHGVLLTR